MESQTQDRFELCSRDLCRFAAFPSIVTEKNNQAFIVNSIAYKRKDPIMAKQNKTFKSDLLDDTNLNLHIPAIPSHNRKYGYGETSDGLVFPFQCPVKIYSGDKGDSVGPGSYDLKPLITKSSKTIKWKNVEKDLNVDITKSRERRFYDINTKWIKSTSNIKKSFGFLCNAKRPGISNSNKNTPGPGSYDSPIELRNDIAKQKLRMASKYKTELASLKVLNAIKAVNRMMNVDRDIANPNISPNDLKKIYKMNEKAILALIGKSVDR